MAPHEDQISTLCRVVQVSATLLLTPIHFIVTSKVEFVLFGLAGGIVTNGVWTRYGGIDYAWTNLAWLPGGLLLDFELVPIGFLLMIAGSGIAAFTAAVTLTRLGSRTRPRFGKWGWRLWVPLVLWFVWVPVPAMGTLTYWYTVAY
jgi:hypothetical protein